MFKVHGSSVLCIYYDQDLFAGRPPVPDVPRLGPQLRPHHQLRVFSSLYQHSQVHIIKISRVCTIVI